MAKFRRDPEKSWHASAGDQECVCCRQSMLPPTLRWLFQREFVCLGKASAVSCDLSRKGRIVAEACVSRTHRRHQRCRPPVLKTGRVTGPHALPN